MSRAWRLMVDRERCQGYANCLDAAPGSIDLDEHDIAVARAEAFDDAARPALELAVRRCPVRALHLEPITDDQPGGSGHPR